MVSMSCGVSPGKFSGMVQLVESWTWSVSRIKWKRHKGAEGTCEGVIIFRMDSGI